MSWRRRLMWACSRSQGQPPGARSRAITRSRWLIGGPFFFMERGGRNIGPERPRRRPRTGIRRTSNRPARAMRGSRSQDHQVIAMHYLGARQLSGLDFGGGKFGDSARELGAVHVANADDVARRNLPFAARHTG